MKDQLYAGRQARRADGATGVIAWSRLDSRSRRTLAAGRAFSGYLRALGALGLGWRVAQRGVVGQVVPNARSLARQCRKELVP